MKNIIGLLLLLLAIDGYAQQIDRSKPPKAGPAPVISFKDPVIYKLPNGLTVLVVEDHKLPEISASLFIDRGPVTEGKKAGVLNMMGSMLNEGTQLKSKAEFDEQVDLLGADVSLNSSGANVSALTRYFGQAFQLMTEALLKPSFKQESFDKIKSQTLTALKSGERSVKTISDRVVRALAYGTKHPSGEFTTEAAINALNLADIDAMYKKYITPSRAYLTIIGDITPAAAKALVQKSLGAWTGAPLKLETVAMVANPAKTEIDIVDVPNATQSEITVINLLNLPMSSPDYFAAVLANQVLGGGADGRLFMNLREKHGFTYGAYSNIGSGRFQTSFKATASVRNEKVDSAINEFLSEINRMRNAPVSAEELKNAKMVYNGSFALSMEDPGTTATFARNILLNNLSKDFYRTYLQKINAVTVADIQRVAKKYFNYANTRVVVAGKQAAILPGLKKFGYEVNQFDKYAAPVTATQAPEAASNITAAQVIENYIKAIGGADAVKKIKSIASEGTMEANGTQFTVAVKEMAPNYSWQEINMGAQPIMKELFNGTTGYSMQMGQKKDFDTAEIAEHQLQKGLVEQAWYETAGIKTALAAPEKVGDADAYTLVLTLPGGKTKKEWYDMKSGLLLKKEDATTANGIAITRVQEYSDYKKVGDVLLPYSMKVIAQFPQGEQVLSFTFSKITVNEGVSADDFK